MSVSKAVDDSMVSSALHDWLCTVPVLSRASMLAQQVQTDLPSDHGGLDEPATPPLSIPPEQ